MCIRDRVMADQGIGRVQDGGGAAVIFFQFDDGGIWKKTFEFQDLSLIHISCRAARSLLPGVPFPVNAGSRPFFKVRLPHGKMVIVPGTGERELPAGAGEWRFPSLPPWNPVLPWVRGLRGADGVVPGVHWLR